MLHSCPIEVRFNELDPYNHVNHATYVTYFEVGRAKALEWCGLPLEEMQQSGVHIFITSIDVRFKAPASAGDRLTVETFQGHQTRRASIRWSQRLLRDTQVLATAEVVAAAVDLAGKPIRPPKWVVERLAKMVVGPEN